MVGAVGLSSAGVMSARVGVTSARGRECRRRVTSSVEGGAATRARRAVVGATAASATTTTAAGYLGGKPVGLGLGLGLPAKRMTTTRRATRTTRKQSQKPVVSPQAFFTEFVQGIFGAPALDGWGLPNVVEAVTNVPALGAETIADAAMGVVAVFGAGAVINGEAEDKLAMEGGDGGGGGGRRGRGGGGGDNDDTDKWFYEDPDGEAHNFFIRGGVTGFWWILLCGAIATYCFLIGKSPHWGAMWCVIALAVGWGMFLAIAVGAVAIVAGVFGVDYLLQLQNGDLHARKNELIEELIQGEFDHSAPPAEKRAVSAIANIGELPKGIQVMGSDAQLVQVELKPGEELSAEPGSMCYMSANVRSITSLQGGFIAGLSRLLAGEPFFLNNFKNISSENKEGYIALAGKREGDKVVVLDLEQMGGEFLCARDSYLCSKGKVDINAAATLTRGQMGLRLFLSNQNTVFMQKLTGTGIACITGNGTVIRQDLKEGQEMVVDARAVVGFSKDIKYQLRMMSSAVAVLFGGEGLFFARLSGPGTFFLQSLPAARQEGTLSDQGEVAV